MLLFLVSDIGSTLDSSFREAANKVTIRVNSHRGLNTQQLFAMAAYKLVKLLYQVCVQPNPGLSM